jgi:hypothetical protein
MRVALVVAMLSAIFFQGLARAQSDADTALVISLHPRVPTMLQLPEAIERAWVTDRNDFMVAVVGSRVYVRPEPGIPAGTEALLEVETRTIRRAFQLRVVTRARDAMREVELRAVAAVDGAGAGVTREAPAPADEPTAAEPAARAPASTPATAAEPAASTPAGAPATAALQPPAGDSAVAGSLRFDLSVHAVVALGTTSLTLPRHVPETGWQSHYALGVRLAGAPRGAWWALELEISSESLAGPLSYSARGDSPRLEVRGPWRRAILGMRAQFGTRWLPSVYAGIGAHAHLREIQGSDAINARQSSTMNFGGVLALGAGLQYRTRDVLLGLDVQVRLGEPDAYRAIMVLVSVGRVLDQGE